MIKNRRDTYGFPEFLKLPMSAGKILSRAVLLSVSKLSSFGGQTFIFPPIFPNQIYSSASHPVPPVNFDGVAKTPISCVVAHFCSFGIPHVWPQSQKCTTPCISKFLLSHPATFCELIKFDKFAKSREGHNVISTNGRNLNSSN